ncbi:MAG: hypothetical protein IPM68_17190 [Flavobacteriales bacterium]|nr:hypothetical protein [Flavobacteriales bacterium]
MSRKYTMHDPEGLYFLSFATVGWIDVFTRREYKDVVVESLRFCQEKKGPHCRKSSARAGLSESRRATCAEDLNGQVSGLFPLAAEALAKARNWPPRTTFPSNGPGPVLRADDAGQWWAKSQTSRDSSMAGRQASSAQVAPREPGAGRLARFGGARDLRMLGHLE